MFQIDDSTAVAVEPTPAVAGTPGYFTDGNPATGVPATIVPADWFNQVTDELLNVVAAGGITPVKGNNHQVITAINNLILAGPINNLVFNSNTTISPPKIGPVQLFDTATSGVQNVTINATAMTPGLSLMSVTNISNGQPQLLSPSGVYINPPITANNTAPNWQVLNSNAIPQGIWGVGAVNYGRNYVIGPPYTTAHNSIGSVNLSPTLTIYAIAISGSLLLIAYNPSTNVYGTPVNITALTSQLVVGMMALSATSFLAVTSQGAVAGSVSGVSISTGTAVTFPGFTGVLGCSADVALLSSGVYLAIGQSSTNLLGVVLTLTGTTISLGAAATGPVVGGGGQQSFVTLASASATSALIGYWDSSPNFPQARAVAVSISGTTVTFGAVLTLTALASNPTGIGAVSVTALTSTTYLCAYSGDVSFHINCAVLSVSGTTVSSGTPVASTDVSSGTYLTIDFPTHKHAYPLACPRSSGNLGVYQYSAGTFIVCGNGATVFTVSGTTVTLGTIYPSINAVVQNIDGTWVCSTAIVTKFFTISGSNIMDGTVISAGGAYGGAYLSGGSATLCGGGAIQAGGTWYPYASAYPYRYPISSSGQGITTATLSTTSAVNLQDYFL